MTGFIKLFLVCDSQHKAVFSAFGETLRRELSAAKPCSKTNIKRLRTTRAIKTNANPRISVQ